MLPRTGSHMNALEPLSSRARRAAVKVARGPADGLLAEVRRATTRLFAGVRRGVLRRRSSASNHHLIASARTWKCTRANELGFGGKALSKC